MCWDFKPYPVCIGRKLRKVPQLKKPESIKVGTVLSNSVFTEKQKISVLQQLIRLFYKDSRGFRVDALLKKKRKGEIQEGDFIRLGCHATKALIRKLLNRADMQWSDYKKLKRRTYTVLFTFFYYKINDIKKANKEITLEITTKKTDTILFFITTDLYYAKDFMQIIFFYYLEEKEKIAEYIKYLKTYKAYKKEKHWFLKNKINISEICRFVKQIDWELDKTKPEKDY